MDEYFVFDSGGRFTGEVMSITEEEGRVFDDLREITTDHILKGHSELVRMVNWDIFGDTEEYRV